MRSHEWKSVEEIEMPLEVLIPPIEYEGFREDVIIRTWAYVCRKSTGQKVRIEKPYFTLGKSKTADFVVTDNDTISRKHAVIEKKEDGYYLTDLDSTNHTYIDGMIIHTPVKLTNGMRFRLAREYFEFTIA